MRSSTFASLVPTSLRREFAAEAMAADTAALRDSWCSSSEDLREWVPDARFQSEDVSC